MKYRNIYIEVYRKLEFINKANKTCFFLYHTHIRIKDTNLIECVICRMLTNMKLSSKGKRVFSSLIKKVQELVTGLIVQVIIIAYDNYIYSRNKSITSDNIRIC